MSLSIDITLLLSFEQHYTTVLPEWQAFLNTRKMLVLSFCLGLCDYTSVLPYAPWESTMRLALKPDDTPEYGTKTEIHWMLRVTYTRIADAIRTGKLSIHLIDNKIQINIAEAKQVFGKNMPDLFT
jgi:hypothetical protein